MTEIYDTTFDKMVTVTVDPDSTRDGANDLRSNLFFDNCTFDGGLTIVGDYHAMVSLGAVVLLVMILLLFVKKLHLELQKKQHWKITW